MLEFQKHFWLNKKVLITGHTGFKGSWLASFLKLLGAKVIGVSNEVLTQPSMYEVLQVSKSITDYRCDISDTVELENIILKETPDVIFHLAAQALVTTSLEQPYETFRVNVLGMASLLDAIERSKCWVPTVLVTSDKVYENQEWYWGYREIDPLGGKDPYSASKACAELVAQSFLRTVMQEKSSYFAIARAGNVIGGGDWSKDRLIPDCYRAWFQGLDVKLRMPNATRPWQHVLEPLSGYLLLAERISNNPFDHFETFNFGPDFQVSATVGEVVKYLGNDKSVQDLQGAPSEASLLALNCDKAKFKLGWHPALSQEQTLNWTKDWYECFYAGGNVALLTRKQIEDYMALRGLECID